MTTTSRFDSVNSSAPAWPVRGTNPFSTRWVRPGALTYHFADGSTLTSIVERLRANNWRGIIVGPHGSGKSTLLAALISQLDAVPCRIRSISLHDRQRHLPADFYSRERQRQDRRAEMPELLLVVDGFERLGWCSRRRLLATCRRNSWGLLVTAHRTRAAIPLLYRTDPRLENVEHLIDHQLPDHGGTIGAADIAAAFEAHQGNIRETLFTLYDLFERRRRSTAPCAPHAAPS